MNAHPATQLMPEVRGTALDELATSLCVHGQQEPIITLDGMILDGRARYAVCSVYRIEPVMLEWDGEHGTPELYVVKTNLPLRKLNPSQRAMMAARLPSFKPGEIGGNVKREGLDPNTLTRDEMVSIFDVRPASITEARTVLARGTAEQIALVDAGRASVNLMGRSLREGRPMDAIARTRAGKSRSKRASSAAVEPAVRDVNAALWSQLRGALEQITTLPLAADVARIARNMDRRGLVDERLARAIKWIGEFENAWRHND